MKKLIILILLTLIVGVSNAYDVTTRTLRISTGYTTTPPVALNASDTINEDDTVTFYIVNLQKYAQMQYFTVGLTDVSGTPNVSIIAYGRVTLSSAWVAIGSEITWTTSANDGTISSTTPINYNYLKVVFHATATDQQTKITTFEVKTSNAYDIPANSGTLTISRATSGAVVVTTKDNDANAATTYRAGGTGALTIGAATGTTAITSSDWAIDATGAMTGIGAITADGLITANAGVTLGGNDDLIGSSTSDITFNTNKFTVAGATGNTAVGGTLGITGVTTATGAINANGGIALPHQSTVHWAKGGSTVLATSGTDAACSNGARYWVEIDIPYNTTLTGLAYLVGSVGGTDSVVVQLCDYSGAEVATSREVGGAADLVGTAAQFQSVAFTAPTAVVAGKYFVVVQFNGTTAKFRTYPIPGSKFIANTAAGTWGTKADITPGTSFVADKGPIVQTY